MQLEWIFDAFASRPRPAATRIVRPAAGEQGARLSAVLAGKTAKDLSPSDIRNELEGNLFLLGPEAFRYFLPAFMRATLLSYDAMALFAAELVHALTPPAREDVVENFDIAARALTLAAAPPGIAELLRKQQLERFDSGVPTATFHERVDPLNSGEGEAVLAFLVALQQAHGEDFPAAELQVAIDRHWSRYPRPPEK